MQTNELQDVAATLRAARAKGEPVTAPTKTWPALDADAAFEVQRINVGEAVTNGDRVVGYKLGNIAKVMQDAFGSTNPTTDPLLAGTFAYEGTTLARERFIEPFVELEPAFVLRDSLRGPNVTVADVITAIDYAIPAVEIIDSRVQNWAIALPDTLADNGSTGAVILGGTPRRITDLTLRDTRGALHFNGREVISGKHQEHPRQSSGRRRLAVQPPRRLRRRIRCWSGHPSRQLPTSRADEPGRALVGHLRGLGDNRIRCFKRITTPRPNRAERQDEIRTDLEQNALSTYPTLYGLITMGLTRHE